MSKSKSIVCPDAHRFEGQVIGDGHCVSFIKQCAGAPRTALWQPGKHVLDTRLKTGTIIATFLNGQYPNMSGYHAAIYIEHNRNGIWVWDQWRGKPVHKRFIRRRNDGAPASNTAQAYRIVKIP
ncbi:MAG: BPSL0067 family protein [Gammaproteobacteria bacterium]|nr:BPSL0067 family protein [Gammaproteobacteria bacterium]